MKSKEKNGERVTIILLLIIVLLLIVLFRCGTFGSDTRGTSDAGGVHLELDPNAGEYTESVTGKKQSEGVTIPGWNSVTIPADETEVTVDFYNPLENDGLYYLTFELRLPDDSDVGYEVLYTSGLVEAGMHIRNITLSRGLAAGEYEIVVHVQPYRASDMKPTNNADMKTKFIVE